MTKHVSSDWRRVCVGDVCKVRRGSSPRPIKDQRYFEGGTIPWIKIADATSSGKYLYKTKQKVNEFGASFSRLLPAGSLILAASGTLGYVQMLGVPGCIHDGWLHMYDFKDVSEQYLYYWLKANPHLSGGAAYGAAIQNINTDILRGFELALPPLQTQRRIASILSTYDDLIENNTRRIAILEEMARRLYEEWFVKFRFPGYEEVSFKGTELGEVPDGWAVDSFVTIAEVLSGGTPKKKEASFWGGSIPFYTPKDAPAETYALTTESFITEEGLAKCNSKLYPKDTVFITARGTVGKTALASCDMAMNQSCYALRPHEGFSPLYLYLATGAAVHELRTRSHGAVFDTIIVDTFKQLKVVVPHKKMVEQFENRVQPVFDLILNLQRKNANLRAQRDLLLPKLVSGQIDVSDVQLPYSEEVAA